MNITGNINLFKKEVTKGDKIYTFYHSTISKIKDDGGVISMNVDVYFTNTFAINDYIPTNEGEVMYVLNLKRAYLSVRSFMRKDGSEGRAPVIVVDDYRVEKDSPIIKFE